ITAFPVITVGLAFLIFDRFFGTHFYVREAGATPILWQHLFWLFGHPEVYILILPAMGVVSDVLPTFSRKPLFGYPVVVYSGVLSGLMSCGVWSHHMFAVGLGPIADSVFAATTMLIAVPTGVKIFNWIATLWGGDIRGTTAPRLHVRAGARCGFAQSGVDPRRVPDRAVDPDLPRQPVAHPDARPAGPERSVGRRDPRVEHPVAATGLQLLGDPDDHEPPAALDHRAPRTHAGSARHAAGADPRTGRIVVAPDRGVRPAGPRAGAAHAHPVGRVRGRRPLAPRCVPLGVRALRGLSHDARQRDAAPHQHGARQPQDGLLGLYRLGVPAVRLTDLDLPRLQGKERR